MSEAERKAEQARFYEGYAAGEAACLIGGSEAGWQLLRESRQSGRGYALGLRQAVWDWEDMNGLPHSRPSAQAIGA